MAEQQAGGGIPPDLRERANHVLVQLALVSEGHATRWEPGHGQHDSRPPVEDVHELDADRAPPKEYSLVDHWAWKFARARDANRLRLYVLQAEEDLIRARKAPPPMPPLSEQRTKRILRLADEGLAADEIAVREHVNVAHVRTVWRDHDRDPVSGAKLPEDRDELYAYARKLADDNPGISEREIARRTGLPRSTLQLHL